MKTVHRPFLFFAALLLVALPPMAATDNKPIIEKMDDLPRHTYRLDIPVVELYLPENRPVLLQLAAQVGADIDSDLDNYDIRDDNTVQGFYGVKGSIALL